MLIIFMSLLSTVVGVIIKKLVDSIVKSRGNDPDQKSSKFSRIVSSTIGGVCATIFKIVMQITMMLN